MADLDVEVITNVNEILHIYLKRHDLFINLVEVDDGPFLQSSRTNTFEGFLNFVAGCTLMRSAADFVSIIDKCCAGNVIGAVSLSIGDQPLNND